MGRIARLAAHVDRKTRRPVKHAALAVGRGVKSAAHKVAEEAREAKTAVCIEEQDIDRKAAEHKAMRQAMSNAAEGFARRVAPKSPMTPAEAALIVDADVVEPTPPPANETPKQKRARLAYERANAEAEAEAAAAKAQSVDA